MDAIPLTREILNTRGGVLDKLMDHIFDVSILVDTHCNILYLSKSARSVLGVGDEILGQSVFKLDTVSPFKQVLASGEPATGLLLEICGRRSISSLFPIADQGQVIGVLGTILFRSLKTIKQIFAQISSGGDVQAGGLYQSIARMDSGYTFSDYIGESPAVKNLLEKCRRAAGCPYPVLITGETGTGKEIISGAIHSARHPGRFVPYITLNCTAIPENLLESELFGHEKGAFTGADQARAGKFELAQGGDILLDEIGDMGLSLQSKLLRVLESREFERLGGRQVLPFQAGILAATNQNLSARVMEGQFRPDLYYRLSTLELHLPALRERRSDIPLLIDHFAQLSPGPLRLSNQALEVLVQYDWPGNVRQLKNIVLRLQVLYGEGQITAEQVQSELPASGGVPVSQSSYHPIPLAELEREHIQRTLAYCRQNVAECARLLGISRSTLYLKLEKYKL